MLGGTMKNNRSAQTSVRRVAFHWTVSLITVGSVALAAALFGPVPLGPAVFAAGSLLLLTVLAQELRPVRGHAHRVSRPVQPKPVAAEEAPAKAIAPRPLRRRVPLRRPRLAKVGC